MVNATNQDGYSSRHDRSWIKRWREIPYKDNNNLKTNITHNMLLVSCVGYFKSCVQHTKIWFIRTVNCDVNREIKGHLMLLTFEKKYYHSRSLRMGDVWRKRHFECSQHKFVHWVWIRSGELASTHTNGWECGHAGMGTPDSSTG